MSKKKHCQSNVLAVPGVLLVASMLSACATSLSLGHKNREISYSNLPAIGEFLQPQSGMVTCEQTNAAVTMALTGFFVAGCETLKEPKLWRVVSVEFKDMQNQQALWIVEVSHVDTAGQTFTRWAPIPWHDWA